MERGRREPWLAATRPSAASRSQARPGRAAAPHRPAWLSTQAPGLARMAPAASARRVRRRAGKSSGSTRKTRSNQTVSGTASRAPTRRSVHRKASMMTMPATSAMPAHGVRCLSADALARPPGEACKTQAGETSPKRIEHNRLAACVPRHEAPDHEHRQRRDRQIDIEDRAQAHAVDQPPAQQWPDRPCSGAGCGPDTDRAPTFLSLEGRAQDGEAVRQQHGRAQPLQQPAATSSARLGASAQRREASANTPMPATSTRLRP